MTSFQGHRVISLSLCWYTTSEYCECFFYRGCSRIWDCPFLNNTEDCHSNQKSSGLCEGISESTTVSLVVFPINPKFPRENQVLLWAFPVGSMKVIMESDDNLFKRIRHTFICKEATIKKKIIFFLHFSVIHIANFFIF